MEKLWTTSEAARCLGIHEADVEQLVRQGKLTGYQLGGKFLRFRPDQVAALKGQIRFRPAGKAALSPRASGPQFLLEFFYFYDFYIVSALLLMALVVYLVVAG